MRIPRLLTLILLAGLIGCSNPKPAVEILRPQFLDAVKPLQVLREGLDEESLAIFYQHGWERTTNTYMNVCTTGSINREKHYWLTAAHCVTDIGLEGRFIEGIPVKTVHIDVDRDLAVIEVPGLVAKELPMQMSPPRWTEDIFLAGHPFGYPDLFLTRGYIANPLVRVGDKYYIAFDIAGAPGNSGSPVLNLQGEIVSVLQIGWGRSFAPVCAGATYENLKTFAQYFTPRTDRVY